MSILQVKNGNQWVSIPSIKGENGIGVPSGGTTGQVLAKASGGNYDTVWVNQSGGDVSDVQINGSSIVSNSVANIPVAGNNFGAVKYSVNKGVVLDSNGIMTLAKGTDTHIKEGTNGELAVMLSTQHKSVFYGLAKAAGDITQAQSENAVGTYTDDAKEAIKEMLGVEKIVTVSGASPTIIAEINTRYICGEITSLSFTPCASGICDVRFTSGSTVTVLSLPNTVKMPDWFDASVLEANTIYEINILDGVYGVVTTWAV